MAINLPQVPFQLSAEGATGRGSFMDSFVKGLKAFQETGKAAYTPKTLAENLLKLQLENKINAPKAEFARDITLADLQNKRANTSHLGASTNTLNRQNQQAAALEAIYKKNPALRLPNLPPELRALALLQSNPELLGMGNTSTPETNAANETEPSRQPNETGNYVEPINFGKQPAQQAEPNFVDLYRKSLIRKLSGEKQATEVKPSGDVATQNWLNQKRMKEGDTPEVQQYQKMLDAKAAHQKVLENSAESRDRLRAKQEKGYAWMKEPNDAKINDLGQLAGAGYNTNEANRRLSEGESVDDLLKEKGFDPKNPPEPIAINTPADRTKVNQQKASLAELDYMENFIAEALGPYSRTVFGFSPAQVKDALQGKNKQQQIDFLAARGLSPELSGLRLLVANARATVPALRDMTTKAMTDIKILRPLVDEETWTAVEHKIGEKLQEAGRRANAARLNYKIKDKLQNNQVTEDDLEALKAEQARRRNLNK